TRTRSRDHKGLKRFFLGLVEAFSGINLSLDQNPQANPNIEYRNPKQIRITKIQMTKTGKARYRAHSFCFEH
ncbi:MAG: hypothetical protein WBG91_18140, partial [Syntrophobacteria bacterium]